MSASEFRQLLESGDVEGCRRYWHTHAPNMPQLQSRAEAEAAMHMARTAAETVRIRARAYSHRWLLDRGLPSQLPDRLKPAAGRLYPAVVEAVGFSVNFRSSILAPAAAEVQSAVTAVIEDCYANGDKDPELVRARMLDTKDATIRKLFG